MLFSRIEKLSTKAIILVVAMIVVSIAATTAFLLLHFSQVLGPDRLKQNVTAAEMILNPGHADYSVAGDRLYAGRRALNDDEAGVDAVASAFGGVATVFLGDKRIATNIKDADGHRVVGTSLAPGTVHDRVLRDGEEYLGSTTVLGKDYVAAYKPLKDRAGATIGILFVGIERGEFNQAFTHAAMLAALAALILVGL